MVGVNVPLPVPVAYHSFGGWKRSLFGDHHIYGPEGVRFYTRMKTVTSRLVDGHPLGRGVLVPRRRSDIWINRLRKGRLRAAFFTSGRQRVSLAKRFTSRSRFQSRQPVDPEDAVELVDLVLQADGAESPPPPPRASRRRDPENATRTRPGALHLVVDAGHGDAALDMAGWCRPRPRR